MVHVVELGNAIAGSVAGRMLADEGCRVTKVPLRSLDAEPADLRAAFDAWDTGKRIVMSPDEALAAADVVIDQSWCHPGIDFAISAPIVCTVGSGLDTDPTPLHDFESMIGALSGVFASAVSGQAIGGTAYVDVPIASVAAGIHIATAIAAALAAGGPRRLSVCLLDVAPFHKGVEFSFSEHLAGVRGTQMGASGMFQAGDGRWLQLDAPSRAITERLFGVLASLGPAAPALASLHLPLTEVTPAQAAALRDELRGLFSTQPAVWWERLLSEAGVPCGACRTTAEWLGQ